MNLKVNPALRKFERISSKVLAFGDTIRCPVCGGQPVSQSIAPLAQEILAFIELKFDQGYSETQVRQELIAHFGEEVSFSPLSSHWMIWGFPVGIALIATFLWKRLIKCQKL